MFDKTTEEEKMQDISESKRLKPLLADYFLHSVEKLKIHLIVKFTINISYGFI